MTSPPIHTPKKSKRKLRKVTGPKRQLIEVAQQLKYIDRVWLSETNCKVFDRHDGSQFISIDPDAEFNRVWEDIVDLMGLIAPVETREDLDIDDVQFFARAVGSQQTLKAWYRADGSLRVVASWAYSPDALKAQILLDKTYSLN